MAEALHPTAEQLLATVSAMLDGEHPQDILVDEVLARSGISRGSLYHHFGDFPGLIEAALLRRFSVNVDTDAQAMAHVSTTSTSKEDYWMRMRELSAHTQLPQRAPMRAERARIIALAASNERFGKALSIEQDRLTEAMTSAISIAQEKGWVKPSLNPRAIAVFLQAYTLGRAVDDISNAHVDNNDWLALIEVVTAPLES